MTKTRKKIDYIITGVKAFDVVDMFERNDFYNIGAQFKDFDKVEITIYDDDEMTDDDKIERIEQVKSIIYNARLNSNQ